MREKYDQIFNSVVNGMSIQAIEQVEQLGMAGLLGFIHYAMIDLKQINVVSDFIHMYTRKRCLTHNDHLHKNYYFRQLERLEDNEYLKMKINSDKTETHWLNINRESIEILIDFLMRLPKD